MTRRGTPRSAGQVVRKSSKSNSKAKMQHHRMSPCTRSHMRTPRVPLQERHGKEEGANSYSKGCMRGGGCSRAPQTAGQSSMLTPSSQHTIRRRSALTHSLAQPGMPLTRSR